MISVNEITMSLEMGLIYGIVALGVYCSFRIINFPDLSCDGSFVLGAATSSIMIQSGFNPYISLLMAIVAGNLSGLGTGLLYTYFKISDLLSGILMAFVLYSINLRVMGNVPNISLLSSSTLFSDACALSVLLPLTLILILLLSYILMTDWGLALRSMSENKRLAQNNGIPISKTIIIVLVLANGLIALSGALFSQHQGFSDISSGVGSVIIGLASIIIGEKILPYRSIPIKIVSCFIGSILYRLIISIALHSEILGMQSQDLNLITGIMMVGIMCLPKRHTSESKNIC